MEREEVRPHKGKIKREHVSQEYQDQGDSASAKDLVRNLNRRSQRRVLTGRSR